MTGIKLRLLIVFVLAVGVPWRSAGQSGSQSQALWKPGVNEVTKIIFDTDMGPDYDDVGALAVLHALAAKGECEILATLASDHHPAVAPVIKGLNRYFGQPDLPVGIPPESAPDFIAGNNWNDSLINRFFPNLSTKKVYPPAVDIYRELLANQPDNSVVIVTVGFTSNLAALLQSEADELSSLSGMDLVAQKVKGWVAMAGAFPEGREFNVAMDSVASVVAMTDWPTPILFSGFEIGIRIQTGKEVALGNSAKNPVSWAYEYNLRTYASEPEPNRPSWDQTAVLVAVRDPERYFYVSGPGRIVVHRDGSNTWDPDVDRQHFFLTHKYPYRQIAQEIEKLMMESDR